GTANAGADGGSSGTAGGADGETPDGNLASSGTAVLPAAGVSAALLAGGTALVLERRRRRPA
ncbi:hypothetical protein AN218_28210, partial [Streptomyces nanshensis]